MILLKNRDRNPSFKSGKYIEINDAGNYPMELSVDGVCKQETTTGKNKFNLDWFTFRTSNGVTATLEKDHILLNGTSTNTVYFNFTIPNNMGNSENLYWYIKSDIQLTSLQVQRTGQNVINIIPMKNWTKQAIGNSIDYSYSGYLRIESGTTLNNCKVYIDVREENIDLANYTFEKFTGKIASPNPDYPQEIKTITGNIKVTSCGKNLFDKDNITSGYRLGSTGDLYRENGYNTSDFVRVKSNTQYFRNVTISQLECVCIYNEKKEFIERLQSGKLITTNNEANYIRIVSKDKNLDIMQVEENIQATPYEPYQGSSLNITIPSNEFVGKLDDTYKDTLNVVYKDDGKYHLILNKMVGKVVLDGSESFKKSGATTNEILVATLNTNGLVDGQGISNYFIYSPYVEKNKFGIYNNGKNLRFCLDIQQYATIDDFKSWLSTHNNEVYYALATPYEVDLGIVDTLLSYDEITNIFSDSDLLPQINAKYYKDFEFDKILRSGYNIDEQEYEIAKKQMANGKRKRILSSYDDCIIKINLGLLDNKTYQEYKEQLDDGEFHYWSYKYNQYKKANFILTKPSITTEYAYDDDIGIDDIEIILEKSSDVS